jgi:hypothetical protein
MQNVQIAFDSMHRVLRMERAGWDVVRFFLEGRKSLVVGGRNG